MAERPQFDLNRRSVLKRAAGTATLGSFAMGSASASSYPSVYVKLYPNEYDYTDPDVIDATAFAHSTLEDHLVGQFSDVGIDLIVEIIDPDEYPEVDTLDAFIDWVRTDSGELEGGDALHVWVNDAGTDPSNTPGEYNVGGDVVDAFTDLKLHSITTDDDAYNQNMVLHEVLHGFMEENDPDEYNETPELQCPLQDAESDEEHACGSITLSHTVARSQTYYYYDVTPLATSYEDDPQKLEKVCNGDAPGEQYDHSRYVYTTALSECTRDTLRKLADTRL